MKFQKNTKFIEKLIMKNYKIILKNRGQVRRERGAQREALLGLEGLRVPALHGDLALLERLYARTLGFFIFSCSSFVNQMHFTSFQQTLPR